MKSFRLQEWRVNPDEGTLSDGENQVRLEPKVMDVLVHLAEQPSGRVVPREEILQAVWGDVTVTDAVLARAISVIRGALGDDARKPRFVETLPKRGFRLIAERRPIEPEPVPATVPGGDAGSHRLRRWSPVLAVLLAAATVAGLALRSWLPPALDASPVEVSPPRGSSDDRSRSRAGGIEELKSETVEPASKIEARALYRQGLEQYRRYRRDANERAIECFQQAIELDPELALAHAGLASAYGLRMANYGFGSDQADLAVAAGERARDLDPELPEAHKALGLAYSQRGMSRSALDRYDRAIELRPGYQEAIYNRALLRRQLGEWDRGGLWQWRREPPKLK